MMNPPAPMMGGMNMPPMEAAGSMPPATWAGNPDFYEHAATAEQTAPVVRALLANGASCSCITICDEFFYSLLGTNAHYGQPVNPRAVNHVTGGSSCGSAAATAAA